MSRVDEAFVTLDLIKANLKAYQRTKNQKYLEAICSMKDSRCVGYIYDFREIVYDLPLEETPTDDE
jgi:hypothetical protein